METKHILLILQLLVDPYFHVFVGINLIRAQVCILI
jgi:hypothetical protein